MTGFPFDPSALTGLTLPAGSPLLGPFLNLVRSRNEFFDKFFYHTSALTAAEQATLGAIANPEGSIVVVPPSGSSAGIRSFLTAAAYLADPEPKPTTFVVAGVGSSAVGTAALARDVANASHEAVGGVVSGFGVADVMTEALGGWFVFRTANLVDEAIEKSLKLFDQTKRLLPQIAVAEPLVDQLQDQSRDVETLKELLQNPQHPVSRLVGHSKGSLVIADTLHDLRLHQQYVVPWPLTIVTFGAAVEFPDNGPNVYQYLGSLDSFGKLNSVTEPTAYVDGAWHHTNVDLPFHLSVEQEIKRVPGF